MKGSNTSEWQATSEKLDKLRSEEGNIVHVDTDEEGEVNMIYIQLRDQRELYSKFPKVIQLDATHRTNKVDMPLYTIIVKDNFGIGQPVCYFLFAKRQRKELNWG